MSIFKNTFRTVIIEWIGSQFGPLQIGEVALGSGTSEIIANARVIQTAYGCRSAANSSVGTARRIAVNWIVEMMPICQPNKQISFTWITPFHS